MVTGAARVIGRPCAIALTKAGADIVGADIAGPVNSELEVRPATIRNLTITGSQVKALGAIGCNTVDQRIIADVGTAVSAVQQHMGKIDILVANAGVQAFKLC